MNRRDDGLGKVVRVLDKALRALGDQGQYELSSKLAAEAWAAIRLTDPEPAEQLTRTLHYLTARSHPRPGRGLRHPAGPPGEEAPRTVGSHALPRQEATDRAQDGRRVPVGDDRRLDVRPLTPAKRHQAIFAAFAELKPGAGFVLVNDHDPTPLRYQFQAEHRGEFGWEVQEEGPVVWRVRISRVEASG